MPETERSSAIATVGYDAGTAILDVRFVSGETYRYLDVPTEVAKDFQNARSQGRFFAEHIRGRYPFEHQPAPNEKGRSLRSALLKSLD